MSRALKRLSTLALALVLGSAPAAAWAFRIGNLDIGRAIGNVTDAVSEIPQEREIEMGREVAALLLGAAPMVKDREVQLYVNTLGRWIASHSERADLPWHFAVLDTPSVNAFATPGGYIFITRGLMLNLRNEAELAGVLGHEIVHVLDRHHLKIIRNKALVDLGGQVAGAAIDERQSGTAQFLTNEVREAVVDMLKSGLDKDDEYDADRKGAVLAARAGYDPYGLLSVLQTLASMNPNDEGLDLLFSTHPAATDRLDTLGPVLDESLVGLANQPLVANRFQKIRARLAR